MNDSLFDTVLVANRGEIARRIIRTLRRLGIRSVAVYSDADATEPHVREADIAVRIGPAAASASYLDIAAVLAAARETGAQAIHPGYGFLSENVSFARACAQAGIVFIGPGERALTVMGDKIRSKEHVTRHGVAVVPGFSAAGLTDEQIGEAAVRAGFPLLVKPSAGGGGKGMQVVRAETELVDALATARRVAISAFGDDTLLLERLIERPRHIEVQVMADAHGKVIHLGERECTLQRRHQKVVEEAPSPIIDAVTRERLGAAACAAATSVDYRGAGTVEFLISADRPDEFFFIEMNTRLQVEHPVTESVTGLDLVELQLRVAAGLPLGIAQDGVRLDGHAIEARVYAESPARGFLPATGDVLLWQPGADARTDAAIESGSVVTAHYDPMIAKVIAHGADRAEALARLDKGLAETVLLGVDTNISFVRALLADPAVQRGDLDTGLIDRLPAFHDPEPTPAALAAAAASLTGARNHPDDETSRGARSLDADVVFRGGVGALWTARTGWRAGAPAVATVQRFETAAGAIVSAPVADGEVPDAVRAARETDGGVWVHAHGITSRLRPLTRREALERRLAERDDAGAAADPHLRAPMPGTVVAVHVEDGAMVAAGDRIVTVEAMKMEQSVLAPHAGTATVAVRRGDQVSRGQVLATVRAGEAAQAPASDSSRQPDAPAADHPQGAPYA